MARLLEFVWRRQVAAGIQRSMHLRSHGVAPGASPTLAVGFADIVDKVKPAVISVRVKIDAGENRELPDEGDSGPKTDGVGHGDDHQS